MGGDEPVTRLFGTDGIRGVANEEPLTPDLAFRVGRQLVATLALEHGTDRVRLVIGRDRCLSGPLLEAALAAGLLSAGAECYAAGVLPTPAIPLLTQRLCAPGRLLVRAAPRVSRRLGAPDLTIGPRPHGTNLNAESRPHHPERLQRMVREKRASVGFAFDDHGDRLISIDHTGEIRDGDYALAIAGRH